MSETPEVPVPALGVIVPTHNRRELLLGLLRALKAQSLPPGAFDVAVVCDGCDDGTAEAALEAAGPGGPAEGLWLTVVEQTRSGAASARNRGLAATMAPLLVFLDDDMIPDPGCLAAHAAAHGAHPGALVLGHMPVSPLSPRSFLTEGLDGWAARRHDRLKAPGAVPRWTDVLTGHLSIGRPAFGRVGGFDPSFTAGGTFGGEDVEFGWRAVEAGVPLVYAPDAIAAQVYVKTFRALARDIREGARAGAAIAVKHPRSAEGERAGRALAFARRFPGVARLAAGPLVALLDRAARRGSTGRDWEALHALTRELISGIALSERPSPS